MSLKKIDELTKLTWANFLSNIETFVAPFKKQGDTNGAYGFYVAQMIPVPYDAAIAYAVGRKIVFEGQEFLVVTATTAAQTPHTNRTKFKWLSGAANQSNAAISSTGVTLNKTSGIATFSGSIPDSGSATCTITNSCIDAGLTMNDIELKMLYPSGDGTPVIANYWVTTGVIHIKIANVHPGDSTTDRMSVIFSIQS